MLRIYLDDEGHILFGCNVLFLKDLDNEQNKNVFRINVPDILLYNRMETCLVRGQFGYFSLFKLRSVNNFSTVKNINQNVNVTSRAHELTIREGLGTI